MGKSKCGDRVLKSKANEWRSSSGGIDRCRNKSEVAAAVVELQNKLAALLL